MARDSSFAERLGFVPAGANDVAWNRQQWAVGQTSWEESEHWEPLPFPTVDATATFSPQDHLNV